MKERIRKELNTFCESELKNDPDSADRVESIELFEGFPAEMILRKADELNCDAIILTKIIVNKKCKIIMFCFQCQETAKNSGCTVKADVEAMMTGR